MTTFSQPIPPLKLDPLLDGKSKVELLWVVGDSLEIANDARVSYDRSHETWQPSDFQLIEYLAWHDHWTPFAGNAMKFRFTMPLFVAREWYRHTIGFNRNEVSRRYINTPPEFYIPATLRAKGGANKQGSLGEHPDSGYWATKGAKQIDYSAKLYNDMIEAGIAAEQARMYLPQNMYTTFRETSNLAAYIRLCGLRLSPAVMPETRAYAQAVYDILIEDFSVALEVYQERWDVISKTVEEYYAAKRSTRNQA